MTIEEYKYKVQERDTAALNIYMNQGEQAYWDFMNANKITAPSIPPLEIKKEEKVYTRMPHIHKDEMQLLREQYYFNQPGIISNF